MSMDALIMLTVGLMVSLQSVHQVELKALARNSKEPLKNSSEWTNTILPPVSKNTGQLNSQLLQASTFNKNLHKKHNFPGKSRENVTSAALNNNDVTNINSSYHFENNKNTNNSLFNNGKIYLEEKVNNETSEDGNVLAGESGKNLNSSQVLLKYNNHNEDNINQVEEHNTKNSSAERNGLNNTNTTSKDPVKTDHIKDDDFQNALNSRSHLTRQTEQYLSHYTNEPAIKQRLLNSNKQYINTNLPPTSTKKQKNINYNYLDMNYIPGMRNNPMFSAVYEFDWSDTSNELLLSQSHYDPHWRGAPLIALLVVCISLVVVATLVITALLCKRRSQYIELRNNLLLQNMEQNVRY